MNGYATRQPNSKSDCAPAYSLLRDVNGLAALSKEQPIGRYTVISQTVSKRNGCTKGVYQPSINQSTTLDSSRRAQSQQSFEKTCMMNTSQSVRNGFSQLSDMQNGLYKSPSESIATHDTDVSLNQVVDVKHQKSHSVTSTFVIRDTNNRSAGGSLSCGQPSPSSTTEDSVVSAVSPNGFRVDPQPSHRSLWLHQSEIALPTDRELRSIHSIAVDSDKRTVSVGGLDRDFDSRSTGSLTTVGNQKNYCTSSSSMLYGNCVNANDTDAYLGSFVAGPSHRKIQNLHHAGSTAQRRYPSDTTLNFPLRDGSQVYTSGSKPGPVTIPARSRSAQPSPGPSPMASPTTFFRAGETSNQGTDGGQDKRSRITRSQQQIDLQMGNATPRGRTSPLQSNVEKLKNVSYGINGSTEDDVESPILPSVREIIRQVEAMTQSNAATSTTDIANVGLSSPNQSAIPRFQQHRIQSYRGSDHYSRGGILRPVGSSQRTPSAPQLRTAQYTPIQAKFNSIAANSAPNRNVAPPVPPHGTTKSKAIIGSFTRRSDPPQPDTAVSAQRFEVNANPALTKKTEMLSNLPTDYQKLREAFIEQRREIQRLRKQLADKDVLINQLQSDIRLYEPWR